MGKLTRSLSRLSRRSRRMVAMSLGACLVLGVIVYATIPDSNGVIHGCYKNNNGTLRVIDDATSHCDNSETPIQWNQTGPQGDPGPQGSPAPPRLITVGTGTATGIEPMSCAEPIRSLAFDKQSATSRLRITYKDDGFVEASPGTSHEFTIGVLIDGSAPAVPIYSNVQGDLDNIAVTGSIMTFGYVDGVSAGPHTLTTHYFGGGPCFRAGAYTIEVEEISQ